MTREQMLERLMKLPSEISRAYDALGALEAEQAELKKFFLTEQKAPDHIANRAPKMEPRQLDRRAIQHTLEFIAKLQQADLKRSSLVPRTLADAMGCSYEAAYMRLDTIAKRYPLKFRFNLEEGHRVLRWTPSVITATVAPQVREPAAVWAAPNAIMKELS